MPSGDWDDPCYETVDWKDAVEPDSELVYRVDEGSWELTLVSTVLAGTFGTVTVEAFKPWIERQLDAYRQQPEEQMQRMGENLNDLFPFVNYSDVFIGHRRPWVKKKLHEIGDFLKQLNARPDGAVYDEDHFSGYSTNELFQTLDFVIATNIALNEEEPKQMFSNPDVTTDFAGDLIAVGGPISNLYTRNLMYGDEVDLPYRYDLNPDDGSDDTRRLSPQDLREIGLHDDKGFEQRPNWRLVERDGSVPRIENRPTVPERRRDEWIRDYFSIVKAPNIHPDAEAIYGNEPKVLSLSGCHGLGTRAAIRALQDRDILDTLQDRAGDGYFQAIGRVKRDPDAGLEEARITVPPEHVRLFDDA